MRSLQLVPNLYLPLESYDLRDAQTHHLLTPALHLRVAERQHLARHHDSFAVARLHDSFAVTALLLLDTITPFTMTAFTWLHTSTACTLLHNTSCYTPQLVRHDKLRSSEYLFRTHNSVRRLLDSKTCEGVSSRQLGASTRQHAACWCRVHGSSQLVNTCHTNTCHTNTCH